MNIALRYFASKVFAIGYGVVSYVQPDDEYPTPISPCLKVMIILNGCKNILPYGAAELAKTNGAASRLHLLVFARSLKLELEELDAWSEFHAIAFNQMMNIL